MRPALALSARRTTPSPHPCGHRDGVHGGVHGDLHVHGRSLLDLLRVRRGQTSVGERGELASWSFVSSVVPPSPSRSSRRNLSAPSASPSSAPPAPLQLILAGSTDSIPPTSSPWRNSSSPRATPALAPASRIERRPAADMLCELFNHTTGGRVSYVWRRGKTRSCREKSENARPVRNRLRSWR